jgi:Cu+-exporting ATPase
MGLATPAAIAVGLGRAAKKGILYRNAKSLELFSKITTVVFDKTGTLTTGKLVVTDFHSDLPEARFKQIVYSLEQYSNHPIARSLLSDKEWKSEQTLRWKKVEEIKGLGVAAEDGEGNNYLLGSYRVAKDQTPEAGHTAYLLVNNKLAGWFDMDDSLRDETIQVIDSLHQKNLKTILLTGDSLYRAQAIARQTGIGEVYAEKSPEEKLAIVERLNLASPVAMVGDGINDAPALAKATIGISLSDAAQVAMQSAQVVLMNSGIRQLPEALGIGKHTYRTIRQNLFWAFLYNIIAIPIAACGFLNPGIAALAMGFSDVVLAANSIRLRYRKVA